MFARLLTLGSFASLSPVLGTTAKAKAKSVTHRASNSSTALSEKSMKRVGAVIDTLDDILASIETEEKQESSNVADFLQWCRDNTKSMEKTLTTAQRDFEEASTADK